MSWLRACYRDRGPHTETEAMKRQSSDGEHEVIELQEVNGEESTADHKKPLNSPVPAMSKEGDQWKSCRKIIFWKCKLWMVVTTIFVVLFLVILISLALYSNVYTDEDDYWYTDALLQNYHNFSGKFNLLCGLPHLFSEDITKRITDVYSSSPALGRYFRSVKVDYVSNESSTVFYQLEFFVPPSTEGFMENVMNPDFIRNVLLQNIYDEEDTSDPGASECTRLKLDPASLTSTFVLDDKRSYGTDECQEEDAEADDVGQYSMRVTASN